MNNIKSLFPIFKQYPDLIYLDNAATTQKPRILIDSISEYYEHYNSNIGRSVYSLASQSEQKYRESVLAIKKFFKTNYLLSFSDGCTSSINEAAFYAKQLIQSSKKYIILSAFEHHANIMPWQKLAKDLDLQIYWITDPQVLVNPELIPESIYERLALIALNQTSNVTGETTPLHKWSNLSKKYQSLLFIDGAQGALNSATPLLDLDFDFYSFSAHKLYGPMGLGGLFINPQLISKIDPYKLGGGIIEDVQLEGYSLLSDEEKLNSGTLNIANIYAFSQTLTWLSSLPYGDLIQQEHQLIQLLNKELNQIPEISIIKTNQNLVSNNILSFTIKGIHSHDVGTYLDQHKIAVRVGKHCAHPLHQLYNISSSVRISVGIYNTEEDILKTVASIKKCIAFFGDKL